MTTISTPPSLDNRFCPNIAIASFLLINLSHNPTQFLHQSLGQHKERIGSCTCPLAVTPPSWSRFLPVRHFCRSERSFILRVRKYELRVAEPFILCRTLVPIMTAAYYHCSTEHCYLHYFPFIDCAAFFFAFSYSTNFARVCKNQLPSRVIDFSSPQSFL